MGLSPSVLVNPGRTLCEVQKILGHSSHTVTERNAHLTQLESAAGPPNNASVAIKGAMPGAA
jgi:hypothetical protein